MQKLLYYFSIFSLLTVFGCKKDENLCGEVNCKNGAICVNDRCDCPANYTGLDCGQQITPSEIRINKVEVHRWPLQTPDGMNWDEGWCAGPLPDLFVTLTDGSGPLAKTSYVSECKEDSIYTYRDKLPVVSSNVTSFLVVSLYDNDTGFCWPSDSMGTVQAPLYFATNKFPSTLNLSREDPPIKVRVFIEYEF